MPTENTGQGPTLDHAAQQISGLLSVFPEDRKPADATPEQVPATEPTQAPAAPTTEDTKDTPVEESEQATSDPEETPDPAPSQSRTIKVKAGDEELEITEDEAAKGYLRQQDYTRKRQADAEEKAKWAREVQETERAALAKWVESAKQLEQMVSPPEPDWTKLATELTPDVFQHEFLKHQEQVKQREQVVQARKQVEERQAALDKESLTTRLNEEHASLVREIPEFGDPEKAETLKQELVSYGQSRGFTPEQLQIIDHRLVLLLHDAMQGRKAKDAAPKLQAKIENKIAKALVTATPGSDRPAPRKSDLTRATQRLRETGRVEDAGAAIAHLI